MNEFTKVMLELADASSKNVDDKWAQYCREVLSRYNALGPGKFDALSQANAEDIKRKLENFIPGTVMPACYPRKPWGWSIKDKSPY